MTGTARINGRDCVLAVFDFEFMGGSMGSVVGEKVALAMELAADRRIPFIAIVASGGARMQEGMLSLVQMGKTAAAAMRLAPGGRAVDHRAHQSHDRRRLRQLRQPGRLSAGRAGRVDRLCRDRA